MKTQWYVAKTGNHQRLIIDENTGKSIAVIYEAENADVISAVHDLLEAAKEMISPARTDCNDRNCGACSWCKIQAAINKAKGE